MEDTRDDIYQGQAATGYVILLELADQLLYPDEEAWVEVIYRAHPDSDVIHHELGEKVWWLQG